MPSTFTNSLRLVKQAVGENPETWGTIYNSQFADLIDSAIAGYGTVALSDANKTLTALNGTSDESRSAVIKFTGTLTATRTITVPTTTKLYYIQNATTGGFPLIIKTAAGTGISVPAGQIMKVASDGTNVVSLNPSPVKTVLDYGAVGDGVTDDSSAFQAALDDAVSIASLNRIAKVVIPPGKYLLGTNLVAASLEAGDTYGVHGRLVVEGAGPLNSELYFTTTSGDALTFQAGRIHLSNFSVTASAARTAGSGSGIVWDNQTTTPSVYGFKAENVEVGNQPEDGWKARNPEAMTLINCRAYQDTYTNGQHGFNLYDNTIGGINCTLIGCRAFGVAGYGFRIDECQGTTLISCAALICGSNTYNAGIWSNCRNVTLINCDIEFERKGYGATGTGAAPITDPIGWSTVGGQMLGGTVVAARYGVVNTTNAYPLVIEYPHFTNASSPSFSWSNMTRAVQLTAVPTHARIRLASSYTNVDVVCTITGYTNGADIVVGASRLGQYLTGSGAPSANANWIGQLYKDTTPGSLYLAISTGSGASDWVAIT